MIYIKNRTNIKLKNTSICLGNFDGVHLGHLQLIETAKKYGIENNLHSVIFSFNPHPKTVLFNEIVPVLLTSNEKIDLFKKLNIDYYIEYPFTEDFSNLSPEDFVKKILVNKLGCKILVVGEGYQFGKSKLGNKNTLEKICEKYNIKFIFKKHIMDGDIKISSSNIREYILENKFYEAEKLLGKAYYISGKVISGKKIGRSIGFPTVNIKLEEDKIIPFNGVFATKTLYENKIYNSITNVGTNPTVNGKKRTVETYIFDFHKNIYGEKITIYFYEKIRNEKIFNSLEELVEKIQEDVNFAKKIFNK